MPTYGYRCTVCKHEFERFQKIADDPIKTCEVCDAPVKKILYPVGIAFKGDGFHVNDYNKEGKRNKESGKAPEAAEVKSETKTETSTTETKTETKSETKTETKATPAPPSSSSD